MPEDPAAFKRPLRAKLFLVLLNSTDASSEIDFFLRTAAETTANCRPIVIRAHMYQRCKEDFLLKKREM